MLGSHSWLSGRQAGREPSLRQAHCKHGVLLTARLQLSLVWRLLLVQQTHQQDLLSTSNVVKSCAVVKAEASLCKIADGRDSHRCGGRGACFGNVCTNKGCTTSARSCSILQPYAMQLLEAHSRHARTARNSVRRGSICQQTATLLQHWDYDPKHDLALNVLCMKMYWQSVELGSCICLGLTQTLRRCSALLIGENTVISWNIVCFL